MDAKNEKLLNAELEKIKNYKTTEDFLNAKIELFMIFENVDEEKKLLMAENGNFFIEIIQEVFSNNVFKLSVKRVLKSDRRYYEEGGYNLKNDNNETRNKVKEICIPEKQLIQSALYLAGFPLAFLLENLQQKRIKYLRRKLYDLIELLSIDIDNNYTIPNICFKLEEIMHDNLYFQKIKYSKKRIDHEFMVNLSIVSRQVMGSILLIIPQNISLQDALLKIIKLKKSGTKFSISRKLYDLYIISRKIDAGLEYFSTKYKDSCKNNYLDDFVSSFRTEDELNSSYILGQMTNGFKFQEGGNFSNIILKKIEESSSIKKELNRFAHKNLKAFKSNVETGDSAWSNKIYLISNKTLSSLEAISSAVDNGWKIKVFLYEYFKWVEEIHFVLNKHNIEDDWQKIENYVKQENNLIEWKSSFYTPMQQIADKKKDQFIEREILASTVNAILSMINTEGGTILVGLVENPHLIMREDVKNYLIFKNNITFFDIKSELERKNMSIDDVKRNLQDILKVQTMESIEKFNNLWSVEPIIIKENEKMVTIYKIIVKKSSSYIFCTRKEGETLWISLIKRADARVVNVDPRGVSN